MLNSCTQSWLTELELYIPVVQIKGFSLRFCGESRLRHQTPKVGRKTYRPKHCDYTNKDEVNRPNILSNNDYEASSQKFRQKTIRLQKFGIYIYI